MNFVENLNSVVVAGIEPFTGTWTARTAAHLARRTSLGPTREEILRFTQLGLQASLDELFEPAEIPKPPLLPIAEGEIDVAVGETWVNTPYTGQALYRGWSLNAWFFNHLIENESVLQARMTLFWMNYFGMSGVSDHRAVYRYLELYQKFYVGNFRQFLEEITVHPTMLEFLNGDLNEASNPNENFARELLELYTIQKGSLAGEGDYTNYTEVDVVALAKALTGWRRTEYAFSDQDTPISSYFDSEQHDRGTKQLSHRFGNAVIQNADEEEYKVVIDIILQQPETARAICRELYRYFVFHDIPNEVEQQVIVPLGVVLQDNDYDIATALRTLLGSQHFYELDFRGPIIKNPYEFLGSLIRPMGGYQHL
ncbi:MAG: DUF1800 family protein, partial [Bacteroidota bacterium]